MERMSYEDQLRVSARVEFVRGQVPSTFGWREAGVKTVLGSVAALAVSTVTVLPLAFYVLDGAPSLVAVSVYAVIAIGVVFATQAGRAYQASRIRVLRIAQEYAQRERTQDWPVQLRDPASPSQGL